jgi:dUTP pyrophosphatase
MKIKLKKEHPEAKIPTYSYDGDACCDMYAVSEKIVNQHVIYDTGIALEIPKGYVGILVPRSSINNDTTLFLQNSVGIIDSGYRGTLKFMFRNAQVPGKKYKVGDRIGQLLIIPHPTLHFEEVDELSKTSRNTGGYGSSEKERKNRS